jgi:hypothetical protein
VHYPRLRIRSKIYGHATGREASAERSMSVVATASTPSVNRLTLGPVRGQKRIIPSSQGPWNQRIATRDCHGRIVDFKARKI